MKQNVTLEQNAGHLKYSGSMSQGQDNKVSNQDVICVRPKKTLKGLWKLYLENVSSGWQS